MGDDIPAEEECLRIHINLWLYQGNPPSDGQEVEIIVKDAQFPERIHLPIVLKNHSPPWITVTAAGYQAWGQVGPSSFCNAGYKVALYAYPEQGDKWYVQPVKEGPGRNVQIKSDCTWESSIRGWIQVAAHLVPAEYDHPDDSYAPCCPPPSLTNPNVLAASCYPDTCP